MAIEDEKATQALLDIENRVNTIAMVHENLYDSPDISEVSIKAYINSILKNLSHTENTNLNEISLISNIEDMYVNIETATPCGLIINELISNSIKYAFTPNNDDKKIFVTFKSLNDGYLCLNVSDNGMGLPEEFNINDSETLGLRLVENLVIQLGGKLKIKSVDGVEFNIVFKELAYDKRI
jgi:two-component sensor histidine kinase